MEISRGVVLMVVPRDLGQPRPGVIVQADAEFSTTFICPMTTDIQEGFALRPVVAAGHGNGLRLRSQIMTDKMAAIRSERIRGVIGRIDSETSERLDRALLIVLGLAR